MQEHNDALIRLVSHDRIDERADAPEGAPNVLMVSFSWAGLAAWSPFGGLIAMPVLQKLADHGLLFARWAAPPLPAVRVAAPEPAPERHSLSLATLLRDAGWRTYWVGTGHNAPLDEWSSAGMSARQWPLGLGYDTLHALIGLKKQATASSSARSMNLAASLADTALELMQGAANEVPGRPWLVWMHNGEECFAGDPPEAYAERYRGAFDDGYDAYQRWVHPRMVNEGVVPRFGTFQRVSRASWRSTIESSIKPWRSHDASTRARLAAEAEKFAANCEHIDNQIGRILAQLDVSGQRDNTLVIVCAGSGVWDTTRGWGVAFSSPYASMSTPPLAGEAMPAPLVLSWPNGIFARGEVRSQRYHASDLVPTILDCCGVDVRHVRERERAWEWGVSMREAFDARNARGLAARHPSRAMPAVVPLEFRPGPTGQPGIRP